MRGYFRWLEEEMLLVTKEKELSRGLRATTLSCLSLYPTPPRMHTFLAGTEKMLDENLLHLLR